MISILSFILVIGVVVFLHELGHFLAAKSVGVRVEKFYIGFNFFGLGLKKEYKGTEYGIGLFPLGGYVKVAGVLDESMDTKYTGASDEFHSKNTLQKVWIMSAGVLMNFVLAILLFSYLTYHNGISEPDPQSIIGQVMPDSPADSLGLMSGDQILSINGIKVLNWQGIVQEIHSRPEELINISWKHEGYILTDSVRTMLANQLPWDEHIKQGMIGIASMYNNRDATIMESFSKGYQQTYFWLKYTCKSLTALISGDVSIKDMGGPVMIASIAGKVASSGGIIALINLMAIISVNLGLLNILPIPGLDGGHVLIALIEGGIRRELPLKIKLAIQQAGMLLLLILFFIIMVNDIQRLLQ